MRPQAILPQYALMFAMFIASAIVGDVAAMHHWVTIGPIGLVLVVTVWLIALRWIERDDQACADQPVHRTSIARG